MRGSLLALFAAIAICASCSEPAEAGCRNGRCTPGFIGAATLRPDPIFSFRGDHRSPRAKRHATVEQHTETTIASTTTTHYQSRVSCTSRPERFLLLKMGWNLFRGRIELGVENRRFRRQERRARLFGHCH